MKITEIADPGYSRPRGVKGLILTVEAYDKGTARYRVRTRAPGSAIVSTCDIAKEILLHLIQRGGRPERFVDKSFSIEV